jgi:hypothetical protein
MEAFDVLDPDFGPSMEPPPGVGYAAEVHHGIGGVAEQNEVTGSGIGSLAGEDAESKRSIEFALLDRDGRIPVRNPGLIRHSPFVGVLGSFCNEKGVTLPEKDFVLRFALALRLFGLN